MKKIKRSGKKGQLNYFVYSDRESMGEFAANMISEQIIKTLDKKREINMVFAAAPSQNEVLYHLTNNEYIDWSRINGFHMDEYIGLPRNSSQSFQKYLQRNITNNVNIKNFHFIDGATDSTKEVKRYANLLKENPIDIVCLGIGENGHIAFNDPPVADFNDPELVKVVELDESCRQQQVNDGCFSSLQEVPTHAITLTIPALLSADSMICTVPGAAKREAIYQVLNSPININCPATILRTHNNIQLFLDEEAYGGQ